MVTLVDGVRVRSTPRVTDDSIKYTPLLPKGTRFQRTAAAPVFASGYWWYRARFAPGVLDDGITEGWVPAADRDGTPWIDNAGIDIEG